MAILSMLGCILFLVGWIWLMVVAFKSGGALWPIVIFFFNWLGALIFCIVKKEGWKQFGIMVVGWVVIVLSWSR